MKSAVIAVVGPTAVGKSRLGIEISKKVDGEIISGDSMQIYKGMDIGTAKLPNEEMQGVPHHMIDIKEPDEGFSAAEFQDKAAALIDEIHDRGKVPVIVGGTGMYIQALLFQYSFTKTPGDPEVRKRLEQKAESDGKGALHEMLKVIDPIEAEKIHPNNTKRVVRAIEIFETTGKTKTEQGESTSVPCYDAKIIGLEMERRLLYNRIDQRVDHMVNEGLIQEVEGLVSRYPSDIQALQAIGYKEILPYLSGKTSLEEAIDQMKRNSRRYAKRQYTYFRNKLPVQWYEVTESSFSEKISLILSDLEGFLEGRGE